MHDVAIAGGGPAGWRPPSGPCKRGFRTVVFERSHAVPTRLAGGPDALRGPRAGAARIRIAQDRCAPFRGIRYLQEDGTVLEARFGPTPGSDPPDGARRSAARSALASGVDLRHGTVTGATALPDCVELRTDAGAAEARLLIAADGLHSPLRRAAGLELPQGPAPVRYGVRRHFALPPWTDFVEVHWAEGVDSVRDAGRSAQRQTWLSCATAKQRTASRSCSGGSRRCASGSGRPVPNRRCVEQGRCSSAFRARSGERLVLIGDAAGYVDAITGQGLSLAFAASAVLMEALPDDLSAESRPAFERYEAG